MSPPLVALFNDPWDLVFHGANFTIAVAYFCIAALVGLGLWRERQRGLNPLGLATAGIFFTCGLGHVVHAFTSHIIVNAGATSIPAFVRSYVEIARVQVVADALTVVPALTFLSLRRKFGLIASGESVILDYQRALGQRERERQALTDALADALISTNARGEITVVNVAAGELLGRSRQSLLGQPITSLFEHPAEAEGYLRALAGPVVNVEATLRRADGTLIPVSINANPVRDHEDRVVGIVGIARDIREQKLIEAERRAYTARLEAEVAARTRELQEVNAELESFAYSISHDLRAPLRTIAGFAQAVVEEYADALDEQGRGYLARVQNGVRRMGGLIDDLLTFSRLARRDLHTRMTDLNRTVTEVIGDLKLEIDRAGGQLEVGPLPTVRCDGGVIGQVFQNLLTNAIKYRRQDGEARIEIGAQEHADEYLIWVRDNGIGFDMRYHDKIWQVFQRLHGHGTFEGTGIGLAIVRRIIERHGGRTWAESSPGQGATFSFTLPKQPPAAPASDEQQTAPLSIAPSRPALVVPSPA